MKRLPFLDWMRGLAVVLMIQCHTFNSYARPDFHDGGAYVLSQFVGGMAALMAGLAVPPTRKVLDRLLPDPGEGPSEQAREKGFFKIDVHARTSSGAHVICRIDAPGDPGYKATAVMLGESALALALDEERLPAMAGVLTPATAMGDVLADRLRAAGHAYDVTTR